MKPQKGHSGFRLPEGYFEQLPGRVSTRLGADAKRQLPDQPGFTVPEGYFDSFADRLQQRMDKPAGKVRNLWAYSGWVAAVAAAVVLLLVLRPAAPDTPASFDDLAGADLQLYLENQYADISAFELAETLPLGDLAMDDVLESVPGEEQILEYLDQNIESDDAIYWNEND